MMQTQPTTLTAHTIALLRDRPRGVTLDQVAVESGLSKSWLSALLGGQITAPSADKIQTLYEHLSKKPLLPNKEK